MAPKRDNSLENNNNNAKKIKTTDESALTPDQIALAEKTVTQWQSFVAQEKQTRELALKTVTQWRSFVAQKKLGPIGNPSYEQMHTKALRKKQQEQRPPRTLNFRQALFQNPQQNDAPGL